MRDPAARLSAFRTGLQGRFNLAKGLVRTELRTTGWRFDRELVSRGFLSNRRRLYPFEDYGPDAFLSDLEIEGPLRMLNPKSWRQLLTDKLAAHAILPVQVPNIPLPTLLGLSVDGAHVRLPGAQEPQGEVIIAKPLRGSGGRGVLRLAAGDALPRGGTYLLEAALDPHPYGQAIFPDALGTVRVLTGRAAGEADVLFLGAAHRFGTKISAPTDNFKSGGVVAGIDPETGRLTGAVLGLGTRQRTVSPAHPDTGARIEGVAIPHWPDIRSMALRCMRAFPDLSYAGWDIAVTQDGPVLIEVNVVLPNPNLIQMHAPWLLDPEVRRFLRSHGVISAERARRAEAVANR